MIKKLSLAIFVSGLALTPGLALGAYNTVQFPQTTNIYLSGYDKTLTVSAGSAVNSITVDSTSVTVILEKDGGGGSSITFASTDRMTLNNNGGFTAACGATESTLTLTAPTSVGTQTVLVSPSQNVCSAAGGGGGGGGGGSSGSSSTTPTPTPSPSPSATPSPSPSPTTSPSPSPSPSATPSPSPSVTPSPSPSPTPSGLVEIPTLPANPTVPQIQAAISAILNNIAYLQAQLLALQGTQPFNADLYYGLSNNPEVKRLQEFLISKGYMAGPATGNYYSITTAAVQAYQRAKNITPALGYFGPRTRQALNQELGL